MNGWEIKTANSSAFSIQRERYEVLASEIWGDGVLSMIEFKCVNWSMRTVKLNNKYNSPFIGTRNLSFSVYFHFLLSLFVPWVAVVLWLYIWFIPFLSHNKYARSKVLVMTLNLQIIVSQNRIGILCLLHFLFFNFFSLISPIQLVAIWGKY